jgi:hypothetical protein
LFQYCNENGWNEFSIQTQYVSQFAQVEVNNAGRIILGFNDRINGHVLKSYKVQDYQIKEIEEEISLQPTLAPLTSVNLRTCVIAHYTYDNYSFVVTAHMGSDDNTLYISVESEELYSYLPPSLS